MTVEEAIRTAIQFERKVHASYAAAAKRAKGETARKVFATLAEEEDGHITYLESRLAEWQRDGRLDPVHLATVLPSRERIESGLPRLRARGARQESAASAELDALRRALVAEEATSSFYRQMVAELPVPGRELFQRFLAIEDGHAAIVQAEIDTVTKLGFWFDLKEFDLEAE
jgi:rubrerythrin